MRFDEKEVWALVHGMFLGAIFLLAYAGGLSGLWSLRPEFVTPAGVKERLRRLYVGTVAMAMMAWATVITGTYIVYPWYRAKPPKGITDLTEYPRSFLLSNPDLASLHTFGMEWKEHVAWLAPILATVVAYIVIRYGSRLAEEPELRRALIVLFTLAFFASAVAGAFGALITKVAPV